ncbi:MAG: hypothetical protein O7B26_13590, partial [Planctomycetota bacterium]|nr:hypothetical protein [Planctomycetota bacterium]
MQFNRRAGFKSVSWVSVGALFAAACLLPVLAVSAFGRHPEPEPDNGERASALAVDTVGAFNRLSRDGRYPFHTTPNQIKDARLVGLPGTSAWVALWTEVSTSRQGVPFYAVSLDGENVDRVRQTSYVLKVRHGDFDPAVAAPHVAAALSAEPASNLSIVQFVTQPLEAYRRALRDRGATVLTFMANNAHVVRMS